MCFFDAVYRILLVIPIFGLFLISNTSNCLGQSNDTLQIDGYVLDNESKEIVPYVKVSVKSKRIGTLSNLEGYFKLQHLHGQDTLVFSSGGYESFMLVVHENQSTTVYLKKKYLELDEVVVRPRDDGRLIGMIKKCKKNQPTVNRKAKGYLSLRSFKDSTQVEMMEGFYNLELTGYDLKKIHLKAARLGLVPFENRFFTSRSGTNTISAHRMFKDNEYFPASPLDISITDLKKHYYLNIDAAFSNDRLDSVYVIRCVPKDTLGKIFSAKLWINTTANFIERIEVSCESCGKYPFLPLFSTDSISNVDIHIAKTFEFTSGVIDYSRIDFDYKVHYISRIGKSEQADYVIRAEAVLTGYNFSSTFKNPIFDFQEGLDDYRKVSAFPYNDFFWKNHDEFQLNYADSSNEQFFQDSSTVTNVAFFGNKSRKLNFEHPFIQWSTNRIIMRDMVSDTMTSANLGDIKSRQYNLTVQIYSDYNRYRDFLNIQTASVFDPYQSFYYLPIDANTNCFFNMYFDICEIERRHFMNSLLADLDYSSYELLYKSFKEKLDKKLEVFLKETDRGTNTAGMEKWNKFIVTGIGINNLELFGLNFTED